MSQLRAKKSVDLYYKFPKTDYERFINKKWIEREDPFESKKTFIERENVCWGSMNDGDKSAFLQLPPPVPGKNRISFFFKPELKQSKSKNPPEPETTAEPDRTETGLRLERTRNASTALFDRESYLNEKEIELIRKFFNVIDIPLDDFFTTDINPLGSRGFSKFAKNPKIKVKL